MKNIQILVFLWTMCFGACGQVFANDTLKTKQANQWLQNAPLQFTENKGQIKDAQILYTVKAKGLQIALSKNQIQYTWTKITYKPKKESKSKHDLQREMPEIEEYKTHSIQMQLLHTNPNVQVIAQDQALEIQNYYNVPSAPEGITNVKSYTKIIYKEIYPKIDLIIYTKSPLTPKGGTKDISPTGGEGVLAPPSGAGGALKYDFILYPGANPAHIQIQYTGQESINLNADGSLTLKHALGELTEAAPYTYQGNNPIPCQYQVKGNRISFALGTYNTSLPLTIDPDLIWATYYGGSSDDEGYTVGVDNENNVYLGGRTDNIVNIAFNTQYPYDTYQGGRDAFLVKFNSSGVRLWAIYYGGSSQDAFQTITFDNFNNIYAAGITFSTNNIAVGNYQNNFGGGSHDGFLVKFNKQGLKQWSTYYGGNGNDLIRGISVDSFNNIIIVGNTSSSSNIAQNGHQNSFGGGSYDAFLAKFDINGIRKWATYYGGNMIEIGEGIAIDSQNNVYMVGMTGSSMNIAMNGYQNSFGGDEDAFLAKFDSNGIRKWGTYYGGTGKDYGSILKFDLQQNLFLCGTTSSGSNIAISASQANYGGIRDAFLLKFDVMMEQVLWSTYYGGSGDDRGTGMSIDRQGNIYLGGLTTSTNNIALNGFQNSYNGGEDAYIVKFQNNGLREWGTYYGGTGQDQGFLIASDNQNNIYLSGLTYSVNDIYKNGHQSTYNGLADAFLAKFCTVNYNPMVSIQCSEADLIVCSDEVVTFNSTIVNNDGNFSYRWKVNGVDYGNFSFFSTNSLTSGTYEVRLELVYPGFENGADPACIRNNISNAITIQVYERVTPTIALDIVNESICNNQPTTLNAITTNVGNNPLYKWYRKPQASSNFVLLASTNIPTYPLAAGILQNGDKLKVEATFSTAEIPCFTTPSNTISSAELNISITPTLIPAVNLSANIGQGQSICNADTLVFVAEPINGGDNPTYKWYVNNNLIATTQSNTLTTNQFPANTNPVNLYVQMTSSYSCLSSNPVNSPNFSFRTLGNVNPFVSLQALDGTAICEGEYARFKANPTGGGVEPLYRWYVNNIPQGDLDTKDIFGSIDLLDKDTVSVTMISDLTCASPQVVNSNKIVMQVNPAPSISVSLNASNPICQGSLVIFTALAQNQGANAIYQWRTNGQNIAGATASTYTITNIDNTSQNVNVDVVLTTTVNCNEPVAISNPITLDVTNAITPQVSIKSRQGFPICAGSDAIFEIDQINLSDPNATYAWKVNGTPVANSNVSVFNAGVLQNGATVQLQYTTTLGCANPKTVNSNTLTVNTQALNAPNNLSVKALGANQINLTWQDNASNETRFRIERSVNNANNFQFLNTVGSNVEFFSDQNAQPNTLYFYRIRALNDNIQGCASDYCEAVGAATDDGEIVTALPKDQANGFKVFPNPSQSGIFQLHWLTEISGNIHIEVFNLMNAKVFDTNFDKSSSDKTTSIDLSNQSAGMYYLKVSYQDRQYFVRVVRE